MNEPSVVAISTIDKKILAVGKEALARGIAAAKSGGYVGDIGSAVQKFVESRGFNVIRELVGHGVGRDVHEEPEIPNWGTVGRGVHLKKRMILAIEPMISEGRPEIILAQNGWTWKTKDGSRAAHFENTIIVQENGAEILTEI